MKPVPLVVLTAEIAEKILISLRSPKSSFFLNPKRAYYLPSLYDH